MLKKVFLAAAAAVILAGTTLAVAPAPAQAGRHHMCHHKGMTKAQKKACKAHKKAWKKAHKKHHLFRK
jgi:hypothetical protein